MSHVDLPASVDTSGKLPKPRVFLEAQNRKAKVVTFYRNGNQFEHGIRVSFVPSKTFPTMDHLMDFLTEKAPDVPFGVRYIFSTTGKMIANMDDLQHGQTYVISGVKQFRFLNYGPSDRGQLLDSSASLNGSTRDDLSSRATFTMPLRRSYNDLYTQKQRGQLPDIKVVTLISKQDRSVKSKVILNLRTPKSFESVLKDLAEAVNIDRPSKLLTESGQEVRSISQLKRELSRAEVLLLDSFSPGNKVKAQNGLQTNGDVGSTSGQDGSGDDGGPFVGDLHSEYSLTTDSINPKKFSDRLKGGKSLSRRDSVPDDFYSQTTSNLYINNGEENRYNNRHFEASSDDFDDKHRQKLMKNKLITNLSTTNATEELNELFSSPTFSIPEESFVNKSNSENEHATNSSSFDVDHFKRKNSKHQIKQQQQSTPESYSLTNSVELMNQLESAYENYTLEDEQTTTTTTTATTPTITSTTQGSRKDKSIVQPPDTTSLPTSDNYYSSQTDDEATIVGSLLKNRATAKQNSKGNSSDETEENDLQVNHRHSGSSNKQLIISNESLTLLDSLEQELRPSPNRQIGGTNSPGKQLTLKKIYGFNSDLVTGNMEVLQSGELVYHISSYTILWDPDADQQRFFTNYQQSVSGLAVYGGEIVASAESVYLRQNENFVRITIWSSENMSVVAQFDEPIENQRLIGIYFAPNGMLLVMKGNQEEVLGRIWDWRREKKNVATAFHHELQVDENVHSALFHPRDEDILVTFGNLHLILWQLTPDKTGTERKTALTFYMRNPNVRISINCAAFLPDDTLLAGSSLGELTLWAPVPSEDGNLDFMQRIFHGHNSALSTINTLGESTVITGDFDGNIRIWQIEESGFDLLTTVQLPIEAGSPLKFECKPGHFDQIYISTGYDQVYKLYLAESPRFEKLINGHGSGVISMSCHPDDESVIVTTADHLVMKYDVRVDGSSVKWISSLKAQGTCITTHPTGDVIAIGCNSGEIFVFSNEGSQILILPVSEGCLNSIKYSSAGNFLAAGSSDGSLYLLPVLDGGLVYQSLSVLRNDTPILDLIWSLDSEFICTDVERNGLRELVLWDLQKSRFMEGLHSLPKDISWSQPEWVHSSFIQEMSKNNEHLKDMLVSVVTVSRSKQYLVLGDHKGYLRLFSYPITDAQKCGFFQARKSEFAVSGVQFSSSEKWLVSLDIHGHLMLWQLDQQVSNDEGNSTQGGDMN